MLTAMLALSQLRGAELWLVFWLALAALYFALMLGVPSLRKKAGVKNVLLAFLAAEAFTDLVWAGFYGYQPVYRNYGVAAVYGLALWPVALAAAAAAALVWGKRNASKKEKTPMWSEKNSLSLSRLAVLLFTGAVAVCDVSGWWLVNWFLRTSRYAGINDTAHLVWGLVTLYVASAAAYVLLWNLYRLLVNIEEEQVFVADNVHHLRAASWCCMDGGRRRGLHGPHRPHHQKRVPAGHRHEGRAGPDHLKGAVQCPSSSIWTWSWRAARSARASLPKRWASPRPTSLF